MKQQVLKALANPPRIFYVPYTLAIINFVVQFVAFSILYAIVLIFNFNDMFTQPIYVFGSIFAVHMILAAWSKREPQLYQIVLAKIHIIGKRIPGRLVA